MADGIQPTYERLIDIDLGDDRRLRIEGVGIDPGLQNLIWETIGTMLTGRERDWVRAAAEVYGVLLTTHMGNKYPAPNGAGTIEGGWRRPRPGDVAGAVEPTGDCLPFEVGS